MIYLNDLIDWALLFLVVINVVLLIRNSRAALTMSLEIRRLRGYVAQAQWLHIMVQQDQQATMDRLRKTKAANANWVS